MGVLECGTIDTRCCLRYRGERCFVMSVVQQAVVIDSMEIVNESLVWREGEGYERNCEAHREASYQSR